LYIATDNADASTAKAGELGGKLLAPPFDVFDAGRMAVVQDPTGAVFCLWQANRNTGIGITDVPGTLCWADLNTPDPERAGQFYARLFGWKASLAENDKTGYLHIENAGKMIGGIPPKTHGDPQHPAHWLIYFLVADVDATTAKAKQLGGRTYLEPLSMEGVGRMAVLADPQGAAFAIFKSAR